MAESNDKIYLEHARQAEQLEDMEDIAERDICFMCPEHITEFYDDRGGLVKEGEHCYLVLNGYPYENTEHHYMALPKDHITKLSDADAGFIEEALRFFVELEESLSIDGGAIAMRFGDPAKTGATVHHLHMHFIVPKKDIDKGDKPVRFRMSPKF